MTQAETLTTTAGAAALEGDQGDVPGSNERVVYRWTEEEDEVVRRHLPRWFDALPGDRTRKAIVATVNEVHGRERTEASVGHRMSQFRVESKAPDAAAPVREWAARHVYDRLMDVSADLRWRRSTLDPGAVADLALEIAEEVKDGGRCED